MLHKPNCRPFGCLQLKDMAFILDNSPCSAASTPHGASLKRADVPFSSSFSKRKDAGLGTPSPSRSPFNVFNANRTSQPGDMSCKCASVIPTNLVQSSPKETIPSRALRPTPPPPLLNSSISTPWCLACLGFRS